MIKNSIGPQRPFSKALPQSEVSLGLQLPLMEEFYTIQGEGAFRGHAAYFIRLGGCDVGCVWCDVKESWDVSKHPLHSVHQLAENAGSHPGKIVVVTGGEPSSFELSELTKAIHQKNLRTHIETAGVYPLSGNWDWVCFSPKKFKKPHPSIYSVANELKVVIYNKSDFAWAENHAGLVHENCRLFLQPEWSKAKEMMPLIVEYVKANPKWEVSLQIHKYMDIP